MTRLFVALALLALLPGAAFAGTPAEHIAEGDRMFVSAFNAGDGAKLAGLYAPDATILPPGGGRIDGREAIQTFWQGVMDSGVKADDFVTDEVFSSGGEYASAIGHFVLSVPGDGGATKVPGKFIVTWKRTGHTWQLYRDIWNTN